MQAADRNASVSSNRMNEDDSVQIEADDDRAFSKALRDASDPAEEEATPATAKTPPLKAGIKKKLAAAVQIITHKPKAIAACLAVLVVLLGAGGLSSQAKSAEPAPAEPALAEQAVSQPSDSPATTEETVAVPGGDADSSLAQILSKSSKVPAGATHGGNITIQYINVGQGDSEFIELPNGKTMLIDAGPLSAGSTVTNYIKQLGYSKIDYLVASHPHEDHIGGMIAVMNAFEIGEIWAPKASNNTATFEAFLDKAASKGITTASAGKFIYQSDNLNIQVLSPRENATFSNLNDASAIIKITYKEKIFAFVGDATSSVEKSALDGHVDILKVGHHGSEDATDAALVSKLSPSFAVISVGNNNYGLPDPEVISLLAMVSVFRTDRQGTIVATSDGSAISFNVPTPETADAAAAEAAAVDSAPDDTTVYITATGKKYHADGCSSLKKSKIPLSLKDAKSQGYTACGKCNPPR